MDSWWRLGQGIGFHGASLALWQITCPFCMESGNFTTAFHAEKKKPNGRQKLNFDTLECGNCKGYVMCLWSASDRMHAYKVLPWPLRPQSSPDHWPEEVGRFWLQAHRCLSDENWDAAAVMARSALQVALRDHKAEGKSLKLEIEYIAATGLLPPIMKDWADSLRELGNDSAHPKPGSPPTDPQDARDVIEFLDLFLEYLYTLPHRIDEYRQRDAEE